MKPHGLTRRGPNNGTNYKKSDTQWEKERRRPTNARAGLGGTKTPKKGLEDQRYKDKMSREQFTEEQGKQRKAQERIPEGEGALKKEQREHKALQGGAQQRQQSKQVRDTPEGEEKKRLGPIQQKKRFHRQKAPKKKVTPPNTEGPNEDTAQNKVKVTTPRKQIQEEQG